MSPQFLLDKLQKQLNLINQHRVRERWQLPQLEFAEAESAIASTEELSQLAWQALPYNQYWGAWSQNFALRTHYHIPSTWDTNNHLALYFPLGDGGDAFEAHPEALIYVDGTPFTTTDVRHQEITLPAHLKDHQSHDLYLHGWTGLGHSLFGDDKPLLYLRPCELRLIDNTVHEFVVLARNAISASRHLPEHNPIRQRLLKILRDHFRQIDTRYPIGERFYESIAAVLPHLREAIGALEVPSDITIHAVGHAHIDTAWLWTLATTKGKTARTFHTVVHLMERYPNYRFVQSQPQLYAYIQDSFPALFDRIKARVQTDQWEPIGGMWVESDCNVPSGESLARQFLYGQHYFKEYFGAYTEVAWLPDTFGFSHTFPQIATEAGIKYFFTTKLRWNETNELPHDTFIWRGLDGSELISHFTPTPMQQWLRMPTYNANLNAQSAIETYSRMHDKDTLTRALMAFGWGDGGGGATPEMLDNMGVLGDFPAVPRVKPTKALDFFKSIEAEHGKSLPVWDGDLYLETHQGTLTSQAWIKKANRQAEIALHDLEFLATWADAIIADYVYPQQKIKAFWLQVLLHQFHDILPGSSIKEVYDDAKVVYADLFSQMDVERDKALSFVAAAIGGDVVLFNTTSFERDDIALWKNGNLNQGQGLFTVDGVELPTQPSDDGLLIDLSRSGIDRHSAKPLVIKAAQASDSANPAGVHYLKTDAGHQLSNASVMAQFDDAGNLQSLSDQMATYLKNGNQFQIFEDRPLLFDAWNIDPDFEDKMWLAKGAESIEIVEQGDLRVTLKIVRNVMSSTITQYISLTKGLNRLDFRTQIDWQERHMLLKVAFPLNFMPQDIRTGTQWGETKIPTHRNTSWEQARYERPFQQYIIASAGNQQMALLCDYKYGFDVKDNLLRLTLLKGATYPDPTADLGQHEFTYSLLLPTYNPETNAYTLDALKQATLQQHSIHATNPNRPLKQPEATFHNVFPRLPDDVLIETVKKSEDGEAVVMRLRETTGTKTIIPVADELLTSIWRSNILEERLYRLDEPQITLKPYQVSTFLIEGDGVS